ncbi:MAG: purine-binding chemotaxis protein CheW [Epsilonproteobacteria bacterium]|nr:purine-binding chemotaxis protein CheW [Campylobacterota bacterium]
MQRYLLFKLNDEVYAINSSEIREIIDYTQITPIPKINTAVLGVANIRGELYGVIDLKKRLNLPPRQLTNRASFVLVNAYGQKDNQKVALLVDSVEEVTEVRERDVLAPVEFGTKIDIKFVENIIRYGDKENEYAIALKMPVVVDLEELSKTKD